MTNIGIIFGRFNPPSAGHRHLGIHAQEGNDIVFVVIIQGEKTGADLVRNPLPFDLKRRILKQALPKAEVIRYNVADVPKITVEIIKSVMSYDKKYHFSIYTGSDRVGDYARQTQPKYIKQIKKDLGDDTLDITFEIRTLERDESSKSIEGYLASKVRAAIRSGKDGKAKKMMAVEDDDLYDEIKGYVMAGAKKEAVEA